MTTFAVTPEAYSVTLRRRVLASPAASGFVHSRQTNTAYSDDSEQPEARVFRLEWEYASLSDWTTIQGYFDDTQGGVLPVTFTPPQAGAAISCRMVRFESQQNHRRNGTRIVVELEEVL